MIKKRGLKTTDNVKAQFFTYCKICSDFGHCMFCLISEVTIAAHPDGSDDFIIAFTNFTPENIRR